MSQQDKVREFHEKFGQYIADKPSIPPIQIAALRCNLIEEEAEELYIASAQEDLIGVADALADLLYVVLGTAVTYGIQLDKVFDEVHRSNMTKVWENGEVRAREDGKVLKPPTYSPPNIKSCLQ